VPLSPESGGSSKEGEWQNLAAAIAAEKPSKISDIAADEADDADGDSKVGKGTKKGPKKKNRNVGGWVSPMFASEIERSWLEADKYESNLDLSKYVPQVGDVVL
jgi:hypothetical protein